MSRWGNLKAKQVSQLPLDRCRVDAALFCGRHEDAGLATAVLGRKNVLGSIPVEFGLPATTVGRLGHHAEVF